MSMSNNKELFGGMMSCAKALTSRYQWEFNDSITRDELRNDLAEFFSGLVWRKLVSDVAIVSDQTNNTPDVVDANGLILDVHAGFPDGEKLSARISVFHTGSIDLSNFTTAEDDKEESNS
jgi:hypothetical protein